MLDVRVATFLAVCRKLNYTHAARELNLTQSAVSQHMAYLEKHYGAKLVAFEGKTMRLTEAGRLLRRAFQSFAHDETLLARLISDAAHHQVHVTIGMTLTAGEYIVAPALARYLAKYPEMRVTVVSRSTEELLDSMARGEIDCAFLEGFFEKSELAWDTMCSQELVCVCAPDHPLASRTVTWEDVFAEQLVVREPESGSRAVLEHELAGMNYSLASFRATMEASSIGVIKAFVKAGLGITFVYEAAVREDLEKGELCLVCVDEASIFHDISFVWPKGSVFESEFRALFEGVLREFANDADASGEGAARSACERLAIGR